MAFFNEAIAKIEDCVELLESDKSELKSEIQTLKEDLQSVGDCRKKYIKDSIDLLQQEVDERVVELNALNQALTEIDCWTKRFDQSQTPIVISQFLRNFCTENHRRQDSLNSQIRHLKREIKRKVTSLSSKRHQN